MKKNTGSILQKLFWGNGFWERMSGAVLGAFLGLLLLLSAVQFYQDVATLLDNGQSDNGHFIQLNKKVNIFNTIGGVSGFAKEELDEIARQSSVKSIGTFQSNSFKAGAYSELLGFYTELFFESIPNEFLDVEEPGFRWSEGQETIPFLVARDYLALYNFGFAPSQGLPQISTKSAQKLVMDVKLEGNGKIATFQGRIVGFSDRINSILVPASFMDWANGQFGDDKGKLKAPSRIMVQVDNPLDKQLLTFIEKNGLEVSTGRLLGEEYMVAFKMIVAVIVILGLAIILLASAVFILGFQLIISKNAPVVKLLIEQGYSPGAISKYIEMKFLKILISTFLSVFGVLFLFRYFYVGKMEEQGFGMIFNFHWSVYTIAFLVFLTLVSLNISRIRHSVSRLA